METIREFQKRKIDQRLHNLQKQRFKDNTKKRYRKGEKPTGSSPLEYYKEVPEPDPVN